MATNSIKNTAVLVETVGKVAGQTVRDGYICRTAGEIALGVGIGCVVVGTFLYADGSSLIKAGMVMVNG